MKPDTKAVDLAVPVVREMLAAAGVRFKFAGGVAVVHHGHERLTDDVNVIRRPRLVPSKG